MDLKKKSLTEKTWVNCTQWCYQCSVPLLRHNNFHLHAALTEWNMRAQLREAETGSIIAQRKILHVNQLMAFAVKKYYYSPREKVL